MSNSKKVIKNGIYGTITQSIFFLLKFIERRFFVIYLSVEYLGLKSLFGNLFTLFSVTEFGIGQVICYQLYEAIAKNDKDEINKLMTIYKVFYFGVGVIILFLGLFSNLFLPYIITNQTVSWDYLRQVYLLMLANMVIPYFLTYRHILYMASQREYVISYVSIIAETIMSIIELIVIYLSRDFILYLCIDVFKSIIINSIVLIYAKNIFPYLEENKKITKLDLRKRRIFFDIKNLLWSKLAIAVFFGTDNILISKIFGINWVAIYSNYYLLYTSIKSISFNKYVSSLNPSIANFLHLNHSVNDRVSMFNNIDLFNHYLAMFFGISFLLFSNTFIFYWLGIDSVFDLPIVIVFCFYIYIELFLEAFNTFRSTYGDFDFDRRYYMYAAIVNIVGSVILSGIFKISGIIIGSIIGFFFIEYGRGKYVVERIINIKVKSYIYKHLLLLLEYVILLSLTLFVTSILDYSLHHLIIRIVYFIILLLFTICVSYRISKDFRDMKDYIISVFLQYETIKRIYNKIFIK